MLLQAEPLINSHLQNARPAILAGTSSRLYVCWRLDVTIAYPLLANEVNPVTCLAKITTDQFSLMSNVLLSH